MSDIEKYNQEVQYQNRSIINNGNMSVGKDIFTKSDETLFLFCEGILCLRQECGIRKQ